MGLIWIESNYYNDKIVTRRAMNVLSVCLAFALLLGR